MKMQRKPLKLLWKNWEDYIDLHLNISPMVIIMAHGEQWKNCIKKGVSGQSVYAILMQTRSQIYFFKMKLNQVECHPFFHQKNCFQQCASTIYDKYDPEFVKTICRLKAR